MDYDRDAFLTSALSGATVGAHYVQNANRANIRSALAGYATNLIETIKSDYPAASVEDILGGRCIVPVAGVLRQTSLPYQQPTTAEWTEIPAQYQTTLRIQHQGIDETLSAGDIYRKRLTVFFNASNQPVLRLDGEAIATGSAAAPDAGDDGAGDDGVNSGDHAQSYEPIDLQTGDYLHEHTDLTIGGSAFPFGLGFRRSYNSGTRFEDGPLGLGWTHRFQITALSESDGFQGLGADSLIDAAAAMVEQVVANDPLYGDKTVERLVVASVAHRWFMDQLIDNVVTVSEPEATSKYVKLPDESYHPPPHLAGTLVRNPDQTWQATTKHGIVLVFDADGKISSWKDSNNNTVGLTYSSGRLQSVQNGMNRVLSFTYSGDRISTAADGTGRKVTYSYDAAGNLMWDGVRSFGFDVENRLLSCSAPGHAAAYAYDSLGRRTSKTADGATTRYVHDGLQVIAEYDNTDNLLRRYDSSLIDDPICMKTGSASYSYHFDGSGSVAALSDASGKVAERYAYSPYGIANEASGVGNPYLFTGRAFDAETGLYYFRSRYCKIDLSVRNPELEWKKRGGTGRRHFNWRVLNFGRKQACTCLPSRPFSGQESDGIWTEASFLRFRSQCRR